MGDLVCYVCYLLSVSYFVSPSEALGVRTAPVMFDDAFWEHEAWDLQELCRPPRSALSDGTGLTAQFGGSTSCLQYGKRQLPSPRTLRREHLKVNLTQQATV